LYTSRQAISLDDSQPQRVFVTPMDRNEISTGSPQTFGGVTPILRVSGVQASVDYYTRVLGFKIDFFEIIASVSRDRCGIFLVQGDQGHVGGWEWIGVSDVNARRGVSAEWRDHPAGADQLLVGVRDASCGSGRSVNHEGRRSPERHRPTGGGRDGTC
jgi:catechol 2,3-dioxygenase-like lactoylglutathione lyase family enzyme